MNKELLEFYKNSYSLQHTMRYSMVPSVKTESVAEHSFYVALGVMLMHDEYAFSLELALQIALSHDLPEMYIDDINHMTKHRFPKVAQALKEAEASIVDEMPPAVGRYVELYDIKSVEAVVVHFADALQCYQKANNEIKMGNNGYFVEVRDNSLKRMARLEEQLKGYKRADS